MKLKNKQTGESYETTMPIVFNIKTSGGGEHTVSCGSITELNEKWEDYEEPKNINEIDVVLEAIGEYCNEHSYYSEDLEKIKILNIVEKKLKAWKRLKDKGFRFEGIKEDYTRILQSQTPFRTGKRYLQFNKSEDEDWMKENWNDLDLLFGGEE